MYERAFDTDWESLSAEEAVRRMYALGIAAELGHDRPEERRRIRDLASNAYERSVLDLSFEEGKREVAEVRPHHESDAEAWSELIEHSERSPSPSSLPVDRTDSNSPGAVDKPALLDGFDPDDLERVRLPSLLKRDED
jgi:hypothetical protein